MREYCTTNTATNGENENVQFGGFPPYPMAFSPSKRSVKIEFDRDNCFYNTRFWRPFGQNADRNAPDRSIRRARGYHPFIRTGLPPSYPPKRA